MHMLQLYNTLTERKEEFIPRAKNHVKIFTCGPSVYQPPHIGNYRTFLYEDVLVRYLRYRGYEVHRGIILTDIEDKALEEAKKHGQPIRKLTDENAKRFFREAKELSIELPDEVARSSTTVEEAIEIIQTLLRKGVAYRHGNNIYFDVRAFPAFGRLYKLDMSTWPKKRVRFSRDTYNGRRWNRGDFILWHGISKNEELVFDAPFGPGRPSWNVQDPAAVIKHLGAQIDINCGGIDNLYRHHDYNIAVMEAYTGKTFARYYLHGEHLLVGGKTMSKSKGNIIYPGDVYRMGFSPRHLRFFLLSKHYRKKLNYSENALRKAAERLNEVREHVRALTSRNAKVQSSRRANAIAVEIIASFESAMDDDLDVSQAFDAVATKFASLVAMQASGSISIAECAGVRNALESIDSVLQVLL